MNKQKTTFLVRILLLAAILFTLSCAVGGGDEDDNSGDYTQQETLFNLSAVTNEKGIATVSFNVAEGTSKFMVMASTGKNYAVRFESVVGGSGQNYLEPGQKEITMATDYFAYINAASAPSRDVDPEVDADERYTASAKIDGPAGENVTFTVASKADPQLSNGRMRVNLFFVGDAGQEQTTRDVVESALQEFRGIFMSKAAIELDVNEYEIDGPERLPIPLYGDKFYRSASSSAQSPAVNVFIGGDIEGLGGSGELLGISAGIPGPAMPSERSGVAISFFSGAGPDGIYSSQDVRILGETLAHESAHFMGLYHVVDFSGNVVDATDPLDDTPSCSFITECVGDDSIITNLLFPNPVPDGSGGYVRQNNLTKQQQGVLNRYIVVE